MRARCLIIMARVPRLGQVKTRLASAIGSEAALAAHRQMLLAAMALRNSVQVDEAVLCISGQDDVGECLRLARKHGFVLAAQSGEGLGARMQAAMQAPLQADRLVVLIGCDLPALQATDISDAFDSLQAHDAVFIPTEDGGYGLIGLAREIPQLFAEQSWGDAHVMQRSRAVLRSVSARWHELRTLWDVDDEAGYRRWQAIRQRGEC
jgi:rSAM/selenodomain-associated transferase 1